ncbi:MAG: amino acid ABC transporter substrate-binding protein [bacterium]|nr:amino acid ABC transporter substrate-binding protein [bacterium]
MKMKPEVKKLFKVLPLLITVFVHCGEKSSETVPQNRHTSPVLSQPVPEDQVLHLTGDVWPPFNEGVEGKEPTGGYAVAVTRKVFTRAGVPFEMTLYPWKRCLAQMKTGGKDAIWLITKNKEREEYMVFSEPLFVDPYLVYYSVERMKKFTWTRWEELKTYRVGIIAGFNYGDSFWKAAKKYRYKTDEVKTDIQNVRKLVYNRVDIIIINKTVAEHIILKNPEFRGKIAPARGATPAAKAVKNAVCYMAFSKKSARVALLPKINAAIRSMKADGTITRILNKPGNQ